MLPLVFVFSLKTGFLLRGKAEFVKEGPLYDQMHDQCTWASRVLIFTPESCKQTI